MAVDEPLALRRIAIARHLDLLERRLDASEIRQRQHDTGGADVLRAARHLRGAEPRESWLGPKQTETCTLSALRNKTANLGVCLIPVASIFKTAFAASIAFVNGTL
ncbi:hypothetical protein [Paraburkholderia atlantica]|uniref:hypothetical protein n=1 Tax=Paraburkholderia atlantica TaxID=2654982 RepID=UPI0012FF3B02|nr:hypothetical protein [Paraburkholderia atlantica]